MLRHKFKLVIILLFSLQVSAKWHLQELARASNAVLVLMDESTSSQKKSCGLSSRQVSQASQKLQSLTDQRIAEIKNHKNQIHQIEGLVNKCETDCTCDIYDYSLEKLVPEVSSKQEVIKLTMDQRKKCYSQLKNFCRSALFLDIAK